MATNNALAADPRYGSDGAAGCWDRPFFKESSYVASIYADALRDNFIVADISDPAKLDALLALKEKFNEETASARPRLDVLLKIEAHLVQILPDHVTVNRFWAILDRFERVVPATARAQYWSNVPQKGDPKWQNDEFIVRQARALLDVIHANYMINLGREKSIRRLKIVLLGFFVLTTVMMFAWSVTADSNDLRHLGYGVLAYAGMLGAIMSIVQRLQTAISHDAMTTDGIFELIGLRLGWTGIMLSVISGGIFALVLYFTVMGGLFMAAVPSSDVSAPPFSVQAMEDRLSADLVVLEKELKRKQSATKGTDGGADVDPVESTPERNSETIQTEIDQKSHDLDVVRAERQVQAPSLNTASTQGQKLAKSLGLLNGTSFFKMLILAFLAGFAERMVPDILERLRKGASGA